MTLDQLYALELEKQLRQYQYALEHAVKIIESYEMDMRIIKVEGTSLAALGICQGSIYAGARTQIERIKNGAYNVDE